MGLDMYLKAEKYVSGFSHRPDPLFAKIAELMGITPASESPSITVNVTVGYWRKANAIHAWFIEHCAEGDDNQRDCHVERDDLAELRDACNKVLEASTTVPGDLDAGTIYYPDGRVEKHLEPGQVIANPTVAAELLPTQSGFFFGNTDYNEWYLDDLKHTVAIIDRVLTAPALTDCEFRYRASW